MLTDAVLSKKCSGQIRGLLRALQRAGEDDGEGDCAQERPERAHLCLAAVGQREIGATRVLAGQAPRGLAVPDQVKTEARRGLGSRTIASRMTRLGVGGRIG